MIVCVQMVCQYRSVCWHSEPTVFVHAMDVCVRVCEMLICGSKGMCAWGLTWIGYGEVTDGPQRRVGESSTGQDLNVCECVPDVHNKSLSGCASVAECVRRLLYRGIETQSLLSPGKYLIGCYFLNHWQCWNVIGWKSYGSGNCRRGEALRSRQLAERET